MGQQRERPGLTGHLAHGELDQPRLEAQSGEVGGLHDRPLEFVAGHCPEKELVGGDRAGELRMSAEASVHVGTHPEHDRAADRQQRVDEREPQIGVVAEGEQLLELVDNDQLGGVVLDVKVGSRPGREQACRADSGDLARQRGGDDAGPQDGRLSAPGGADDRQEPSGSHSPDELGYHLFAAEEQVAVLGLEGDQPPVRALGRGHRCRHPGALECVNTLGRRHPLKTMRAEIHQRAAGRQMPGDQVGGHRGEQDLPAVCLAAQPGGQVDHGTDVAGSATVGLAGVEAEPRADAQVAGPSLRSERMRGRERAGHRCRGRVENRDGRISLTHRSNEPAPVDGHAVRDQLVMAHERLRHRRGPSLPHGGGVLDVRHAERDDAGRQRGSPARTQAFDQLSGRRRTPARIGGHPHTDGRLELVGLRRVHALP